MDLGLTDKLALVTGSTAGIGYATCEALVREAARVIVNGRSKESVDAAVAKLDAIPRLAWNRHGDLGGLALELDADPGTARAFGRGGKRAERLLGFLGDGRRRNLEGLDAHAPILATVAASATSG